MKQKRYWLRGGILFTALFFVYLLNNLDPAATPSSPSTREVIFLIILAFILGSAAGLIYDKLKNKKKYL